MQRMIQFRESLGLTGKGTNVSKPKSGLSGNVSDRHVSNTQKILPVKTAIRLTRY